MRILIVGAGALGGYVGARLLAAHKSVTFLVRPPRAEQLARNGLRLESPLGDHANAAVRCVTANTIDGAYDLVVIACKSCDLAGAMKSFAPAIGPDTGILPLLNGVGHLDTLADVYGRDRVLGGQCTLAAKRLPDGTIRHLNDAHALTLGEVDGSLSPRVEAWGTLFGDAGFQRTASRHVVLEMWEKFAFIASALCITLLTRVRQDRSRTPVAPRLAGILLNECRAVAATAGFALRATSIARTKMILEAPDSTLFELLFDDLRRYPATETDDLLDDLVQRARHGTVVAPHIEEAHAALQCYRSAPSSRAAYL